MPVLYAAAEREDTPESSGRAGESDERAYRAQDKVGAACKKFAHKAPSPPRLRVRGIAERTTPACAGARPAEPLAAAHAQPVFDMLVPPVPQAAVQSEERTRAEGASLSAHQREYTRHERIL